MIEFHWWYLPLIVALPFLLVIGRIAVYLIFVPLFLFWNNK